MDERQVDLFYRHKIHSILQWGFLILLIGGLEVASGLGIVIHPLHPGLFIFASVVIVFSLINPRLGITILILTIPFAYGYFNLDLTKTYSLDLAHIVLFCLICLNAIVGGAKSEIKLSGTPLDKYFFLFLLWASFTILWAPTFSIAAVHLSLLFAAYLFYYVTYYSIQDRQSLDYAIWGWWLVGLLFFCIGIIQYLGIIDTGVSYKTDITESYSRVTGFSGSPSAFAGIMLLVFFAMLGATQLFDNKTKKALAGGVAVLSLLTITLTLSRSAFIGLFSGVFFYSLKYLRKMSSKYFLFLFLLLSAFFLFGTMAGIQFEQRLQSILHFYEEDAWIIRLSVWLAILQMVSDTYGFGVGAGGMEPLFKKYYNFPLSYPVQNTPPHAHSLYMDVLAHFGIIGLLLLVILMVRLAYYLFQSYNKVRETDVGKMLWPLCCGLVAACTQVLITERLHTPKIWIFLGMTIACVRLAEREADTSNQDQMTTEPTRK